MAGNLSNYLENKLIDHFLGTASFTMPSTVYIALYTGSALTDASTGASPSPATEVSGGSYSRKSATFSSASSGSTTNNANIDFSGMPACTVTGIAVLDGNTAGAGNILVYGSLTSSKTLDAGDTLRISSGDLSISID
jgi:hypothetical protein